MSRPNVFFQNLRDRTLSACQRANRATILQSWMTSTSALWSPWHLKILMSCDMETESLYTGKPAIQEAIDRKPSPC
jgi:hypothetical protein